MTYGAMRVRREIVLDTETTGLDPHKGHRLVEIGCVELVNYMPTGRTFQLYLNPERDMPQPAFAVHGLSETFLSQFEVFPKVAESFLAFIADLPLVIHNAGFDMKFLQAELMWAGLPPLSNPVIDTLTLARQKFPGSPASLDMLCRRFQINNTHREKHGALLDAEILAQVYLELCGGCQPHLSWHAPEAASGQTSEEKRPGLSADDNRADSLPPRAPRPPRPFHLSEAEKEAHAALLASLGVEPWQPAA